MPFLSHPYVQSLRESNCSRLILSGWNTVRFSRNSAREFTTTVDFQKSIAGPWQKLVIGIPVEEA